jgi:hypothetical protein
MRGALFAARIIQWPSAFYKITKRQKTRHDPDLSANLRMTVL